jgi:hypothetical protein
MTDTTSYPFHQYVPQLRFRMLLLCALVFTGPAGWAKDNLAILPFTGGEDGETIAELFSFQKDLTALFNPVPRTSITRAIRNEQGFQMASGMTDPDTIASLGKQLGARYVVSGTITQLGSQKVLIIAILHTEDLRQIAGDIQTYETIEEIDGKLGGMAQRIAAAVKIDASTLPLLAVPPVQLSGGADPREADALAQILAIQLIRSGKYAVYPRTKSLEQVQEEYGHQFNGDVADEYLPALGMGTNPRLALSVAARTLGSLKKFNAAVINLETGVQEAGDSVDYQRLDDGMQIMEELALRLTGQEKAVAALGLERQRRAATAAMVATAKYNLTVRDAAAFAQALAAINRDETSGAYTITLSGSFSADSVVLTGNAGKTITLQGDGTLRTLSNAGSGVLVTVQAGVSLVLGSNLILNGANKGAYLVQIDGGTLIMKPGSTVRGAKASGVYIGSGSFTMEGGTISGNVNTASGSAGGGVYVSGGSFTMEGGTISGNTASYGGGGVYVGGGSFTMEGGTISGNRESSFGGGVYVYSGSFTMEGGTISGNTASYGGGGVHVYYGSFTMEGGTISGNRESSFGSGVYVYSGSFTMEGGTISGNTASDGGGVYVYNGSFIKRGGAAIDSTNSANRGKVVYAYGNGSAKQRNTSAGPGVTLNSALDGRAGGWE